MMESIKVGYKTFKLGRWIKTEDNGSVMLRCPECGSGIIWDSYNMAIGTNGMHYCPYCSADMWEDTQLELDI